MVPFLRRGGEHHCKLRVSTYDFILEKILRGTLGKFFFFGSRKKIRVKVVWYGLLFGFYTGPKSCGAGIKICKYTFLFGKLIATLGEPMQNYQTIFPKYAQYNIKIHYPTKDAS